jgi:glycosyltransferase involved in cell wall biosynthesis
MSELISVIIPTYNGATRGFLPQAIESVLAQTYRNFELLLIDDGSTDGTGQLCEHYLVDSRVKYIYQKNAGVAAARNYGIRESHGEYICFLDDDDLWISTKLEEQLSFVKNLSDKNLGLCYTGLEIITKYGVRTGAIQANSANGNVFTQMLIENVVNCTSSVMIPRKVFEDVGLFREHLSYAEDYDLWVRIAKTYFLYSIDRVLVLYREHGGNASKKLDKIDFYALTVVFEAVIEHRDATLKAFYLKRAEYRFWLQDYKSFRRYVKFASTYGEVGLSTRGRYVISYFPRVVSMVRNIKRKCC